MESMKLDYLKRIFNDIFLTHSPTGFHERVNKVLSLKLDEMGYTNYKIGNKGNLEVFIKGLSSDKTVGISAHADTLGLMIRSIGGDGSIKVTNIGSPQIPTLDGEYCTIITRDNKEYTGTILSTSPASHVYPDSQSKSRDVNNIYIRLDEKVNSKKDVEALGISNGDYVCIDTKTILTESGYLKSRFIDDKGSVCAILAVLNHMSENNILPKYDTYVYFTNYEEVGHGAASVKHMDEFVAVDMGCIGLDLAGDEHSVSICAKDSAGPYDYELTTRLINFAKEANLSYTVDIFPFYSSDVSASLRAGLDCKGALIGSGVHASHGMERTHLDGLENTMKLLLMYLTK
ncbi:MAG: M42 family metallopeptidase [Acholeplasmatales bacterium]|nr:M42 family metallopeptidase [Acholeplasmatales bacterium]